jgi:signal transduction histidine kinase
MGFQGIFDHQRQKYGISLWQYPQFIFLIMGIITIAVILATYGIGIRFIEEPEVVILIVLALSAFLLIITFTITQSFERLAEANRLKSEFVSIVSHQLRAPLSNLRWSIELLMSGRLGTIEEPQLEYFRILRENSARMAELVRDLLIVSRIEQGRFPFHKMDTSLVNLVKNLISNLEPFARASNVGIRFEADDNLPKIFADPSQLKLIIENLLDNAIRYIKDKGVVEIKLKNRKNNIYFEVKDNGVGIPARDQKYIFQKFFRAQNILRYQTQGTGLGLYIAKSIIERAKGKIGFKSKEGQGTTFWFTLPIK